MRLLRAGAGRLVVDERRPVTPGPGCVLDAGRTVCAHARPEVRLDLGAGDDDLRVIGRMRLRVLALGGPGDDRLRGGRAADHLDGGPGRDLLDGRHGDDLLLGGRHPDRLFGREGHDRLYGGDGRDRLVGWLGNDRLHPGAGVDTVSAGSGRDRLWLRDTPATWDRVDCGRHRDRVHTRDRADHRGKGCERR